MANYTSRRGVRLGLLALVVLLLVGAISVSFTRAQGPQATDPRAAAEELRKSLTREQQQAISAALAAHTSDLAAIAQKLAAALPEAKYQILLPLVIDGDTAKSVVTGQQLVVKPKTSRVGAALNSMNPSLQSVQSSIEADLARILSPDQLALYRAAIAIAPATTAAVTASSTDGNSIAQADLDPIACFNAAQWADYAFAYITSAKAFAIMDAFNVDFGTETDEAIQSYVSYNEAEAYARDGLQNLSAASVTLTAADVQVININGGTLFGVTGNTDIITAKDRNNLALNLVLSDYLASGGIIVNGAGVGGNYFAYFAYAYGQIADGLLQETLARTPACF